MGLLEELPGTERFTLIPAAVMGDEAANHFFINTLKKCAKETNFCFIPDVCTASTAPSLIGWGCHPLFNNILKKQAKKTSFYEMVFRKNSIWLTVNRVWTPSTF